MTTYTTLRSGEWGLRIGTQVKLFGAGWVTVTAILDANRIAATDRKGRARIFRCLPHDVEAVR